MVRIASMSHHFKNAAEGSTYNAEARVRGAAIFYTRVP